MHTKTGEVNVTWC